MKSIYFSFARFCVLLFFFFAGTITTSYSSSFAYTKMHVVQPNSISGKEYVWEERCVKPFTDLIVSWNAYRPQQGRLGIYVSVKHARAQNGWSDWRKLAEWGVHGQQTFSNAYDRYVHVLHLRVEMQHKVEATGYRVKVVAERGASLDGLRALFANLSQRDKFREVPVPRTLPSCIVKGVPRQSQLLVNHERRGDLCSPTSTSMIVRYFDNKFNRSKHQKALDEQVLLFAKRSHDDSYLDAYGNWILNTAQAFDDCQGKVLYRAEKLNSFEELYEKLRHGIPVAVSIRGWLRGGYKTYSQGHFVVVVGWSQKRKAVLCVDPVFKEHGKMLRAYRARDFVRAWGRGCNLSYVPVPLQTVV